MTPPGRRILLESACGAATVTEIVERLGAGAWGGGGRGGAPGGAGAWGGGGRGGGGGGRARRPLPRRRGGPPPAGGGAGGGGAGGGGGPGRGGRGAGGGGGGARRGGLGRPALGAARFLCVLAETQTRPRAYQTEYVADARRRDPRRLEAVIIVRLRLLGARARRCREGDPREGRSRTRCTRTAATEAPGRRNHALFVRPSLAALFDQQPNDRQRSDAVDPPRADSPLERRG